MRRYIVLALFLFSPLSQAQFSDADADGVTRFKLLGKTWSPTFFSLASMETDRARDTGGRISSYNYFSFHTFINGDFRFSARLPFTYGSAGTDRFNGDRYNEQKLEIQDIIFEVRDTEVLFLPWDLQLYWAGRIYLPNSKFSKQAGQIARFRNHFILSRVFSRFFEADIQQKFSYYLQSRSTYPVTFQDDDGYEINASALTKKMEVEHWLSAWGKISAKTGFGAGLVFEEAYYNESKAENKSKPGVRTVKVGPQARFPIGDSMDFILSYSDKVDRDDNPQELGRFLAKNTEWVLNSFISF